MDEVFAGLRLIAPVVFFFTVFTIYDFTDTVLEPTSQESSSLKALPFDGDNFLALLYFIDSFDCTSWILNPIGSPKLRTFANMICMDRPMTIINTNFMRKVFTILPEEYQQEAKRRVMLIDENIGSLICSFNQ